MHCHGHGRTVELCSARIYNQVCPQHTRNNSHSRRTVEPTLSFQIIAEPQRKSSVVFNKYKGRLFIFLLLKKQKQKQKHDNKYNF